MPVVIAIIVVIIAYVILKKTALGLYIESVGINGTASISRFRPMLLASAE